MEQVTQVRIQFTLILLRMTINEEHETFTITLTSPSTGIKLGTAEGVGTIRNDDMTLPVISIADSSGVEDDGTANGKVTFTLSLKNTNGMAVNAGRDIMVNFATSTDLQARAFAREESLIILRLMKWLRLLRERCLKM